MASPLRDYANPDPIFVDSNIFVYQQGAHPRFGPDCRDFLDRVEHGGVQAVTTSIVMNEVAYILQMERAAGAMGHANRRMLQEQIAKDPGPADECWAAVDTFLSLLAVLQGAGLTVVAVRPEHFGDASAAGRSARLLASDATHIAVCQQLGVGHVASNDADLERVPWLTRWEPGT